MKPGLSAPAPSADPRAFNLALLLEDRAAGTLIGAGRAVALHLLDSMHPATIVSTTAAAIAGFGTCVLLASSATRADYPDAADGCAFNGGLGGGAALLCRPSSRPSIGVMRAYVRP